MTFHPPLRETLLDTAEYEKKPAAAAPDFGLVKERVHGGSGLRIGVQMSCLFPKTRQKERPSWEELLTDGAIQSFGNAAVKLQTYKRTHARP